MQENYLKSLPFRANAALTARKAAVISSGKLVNVSTAGGECHGTNKYSADAADEAADLLVGGRQIAIAGETLVAGDEVLPAADGEMLKATCHPFACGVVLVGGGDGEEIEIFHYGQMVPRLITGVGADLASAATIAPIAQVTRVTGTTETTTITVPTGFPSGGSIVLIPTGAWTCATGGNIAVAVAAVANQAIRFTWVGTPSGGSAVNKWYPSNVA